MNKKRYAIIPVSLLERLSSPGACCTTDHHSALSELKDLLARPIDLPLTPDLGFILSRPNFGCQTTAQVLRTMGREITEKAEEEQAATIHWMLNHYLRDPLNWRKNSLDEFNAAAALMNATDL